MSQVVLGETEQLESALRRFKRKVSQAGIFADLKKIVTLKPRTKTQA